MREDVAADLSQRGLEEEDRPVVSEAPGGLAEPLDGAVQDLEPFVKVGEGGVEFKGLVRAPHGVKAP